MATCNDCVHYPVCNYKMWCDLFKDKTNFVEVVRCKDCRLATEDIMIDGWYYCYNDCIPHKPDGFCNYGERKDEE